MNILVTNSHSVRNAGDRVLLDVTLAELRANFPDAEIRVAVNSLAGIDARDETHYVGSFMSWFKTAADGVERWDRRSAFAAPWWLLQSRVVALTARYFKRPWPMPKDRGRRALLSAYLAADLVVSCPGNFFYSGAGPGVAFFLHVLALAFAAWLGKPLYMMPQTIGPLTRRRERWLLGGVLRRMRFVSVRDALSVTPVTQLGVPAERRHVFPDSAFLYRGSGDLAPLDALLAAHPDLARPYLGVTVIDWGAKNRRFTRQAEYEQAMAAALDAFLARHGGSVFIFPQVTGPSRAEDDRICAARIADLLGSRRAQVAAIDSVWTPDQLQAAYGEMDLFLGARLHSNIFALTAGTPVLAVAYQYKTRGVMDMLGLGDWVLDIDTVTAAQLAERLETLWQHRAALRPLIAQRLSDLRQEARGAAALIAADYAGLTAAQEARFSEQ